MIPREKIARLLNAYWGSSPGDWDGMVERGRQHYLSRADEILGLVAGEELDPAVEWEAWLAAEHKKSTYSRLLRAMARRSSVLRQKALLLADEKFGNQARLQREVYRLRANTPERYSRMLRAMARRAVYLRITRDHATAQYIVESDAKNTALTDNDRLRVALKDVYSLLTDPEMVRDVDARRRITAALGGEL